MSGEGVVVHPLRPPEFNENGYRFRRESIMIVKQQSKKNIWSVYLILQCEMSR
jgi:hypothetical protein